MAHCTTSPPGAWSPENVGACMWTPSGTATLTLCLHAWWDWCCENLPLRTPRTHTQLPHGQKPYLTPTRACMGCPNHVFETARSHHSRCKFGNFHVDVAQGFSWRCGRVGLLCCAWRLVCAANLGDVGNLFMTSCVPFLLAGNAIPNPMVRSPQATYLLTKPFYPSKAGHGVHVPACGTIPATFGRVALGFARCPTPTSALRGTRLTIICDTSGLRSGFNLHGP